MSLLSFCKHPAWAVVYRSTMPAQEWQDRGGHFGRQEHECVLCGASLRYSTRQWGREFVFSVDCETNGLYGLVWAVGATVLDCGGKEVATFGGQLNSKVVTNSWVRDNVVPNVDLPIFKTRKALLEAFWGFWMEWREKCHCVSDFGAPVEAGLFRACVELDPENRQFQGPYPMHEVGTALLLAGVDPDVDRGEFFFPVFHKHNPVEDSYNSGLCWLKALGMKRK